MDANARLGLAMTDEERRQIQEGRIVILGEVNMTRLGSSDQVTEAHAAFKKLALIAMEHGKEPFYRAAMEGAIDELFSQIMELHKFMR